MQNVIEIDSLTKNYGKHRDVTDVSFEVQEGDIFGFLDSNGAGKSTTIRSMLGFIRFQAGRKALLRWGVFGCIRHEPAEHRYAERVLCHGGGDYPWAGGGAMFAAVISANMLSKEEDGHTSEFLFSLPIARAKAVLAKWSAVMSHILLFN